MMQYINDPYFWVVVAIALLFINQILIYIRIIKIVVDTNENFSTFMKLLKLKDGSIDLRFMLHKMHIERHCDRLNYIDSLRAKKATKKTSNKSTKKQ